MRRVHMLFFLHGASQNEETVRVPASGWVELHLKMCTYPFVPSSFPPVTDA